MLFAKPKYNQSYATQLFENERPSLQLQLASGDGSSLKQIKVNKQRMSSHGDDHAAKENRAECTTFDFSSAGWYARNIVPVIPTICVGKKVDDEEIRFYYLSKYYV